MAISDWFKQLKAFARRRDAKKVAIPNSSNASNTSDCLGQIAKAILEVRQRDRSLKDRPVIDSLKYEVGQSHNVKVTDTEIYRAIVQVRKQHGIEASEWRKSIKSVLKLAAPASGPEREPTQLLDLLETLSR